MREVVNSHVNFAVADTKQWEQSATYLIDTNPAVDAFVKNAGLGFAIPYFHNGQPHGMIEKLFADEGYGFIRALILGVAKLLGRVPIPRRATGSTTRSTACRRFAKQAPMCCSSN